MHLGVVTFKLLSACQGYQKKSRRYLMVKDEPLYLGSHHFCLEQMVKQQLCWLFASRVHPCRGNAYYTPPPIATRRWRGCTVCRVFCGTHP